MFRRPHTGWRMKSRFAAFFICVNSLCVQAPRAQAQSSDLDFLNNNRPVLDAHNCYPYDGRWTNRIERALKAGSPVSIEQDLAWYVDPSSGKGRIVVSHSAHPNPGDPALESYFFDRVRPLVEKELASGDHSKWPVIILHFDFKDVQPSLLHAVWDLLGEHQAWISTAPKTADPHQLAPLDRKPILVITEDSDAQEAVFYTAVPVGARLRLFGSAHTNLPKTGTRQEQTHAAATLSPEQLLSEKPTDYRRWWNNSWYEVEEGGQRNAGPWSGQDMARLRALVDHAHALGYWIRFYTLDGFTPALGHENGWFAEYNFGSLEAVEERWRAAIEAGVNFIATDQYEELGKFMRSQSPAATPSRRPQS